MHAYQALRERAAILDLTGRGLILVKEEDRTRLLHAMTTNVIEGLPAGAGNIALFLNDKGRILAELIVLCREEDYLIDTEPGTRQLVYDHLDRYIIMDVVELEDVSDAHCVIGLEGPQAADVLAALGAPAPELEFHHAGWHDALVARVSYTGGPGYRVYAPVARREEFLSQFADAGAISCGLATADVVRLEQGRPRHGVEFSDAHLVHEAQLLSHVSFSKGCYLGQEIVERVRSRGNVNRLLTRLVVDTEQVPCVDAPVMAGEKEAGRVLSAAYSPAMGRTITFALLRAEFVKPEMELTIANADARVVGAGRLG